MIRKTLAILVMAVALGSMLFVGNGCEEVLDILFAVDSTLVEENKDKLGWDGQNEDFDNQENAINLGGENAEGLPSKVDLRKHFPPIGDQGQYGTCVAWATGYNVRTYIDIMDRPSASDAYSPKDLFFTIRTKGYDPGNDCNGSYFESAFDAMQAEGIVKLSQMPYENLGSCTGTPASASLKEPGKIKNYRKIDQDVNTLKSYLAQGRAIAFGARLGDNFMSANDNLDVLSYDTYQYSGMHAYHAMALAGYDDSKGTNGAFLVVNSWGTNWGNDGYIWVDYNFFSSSDFCFGAYVASTFEGKEPDDDDDGYVDDDVVNDGTDLLAWDATDVEDGENRSLYYDTYNSGSTTVSSSAEWAVVYLYFNAFDANDFGILVYDSYTDDRGTKGEYGDLESGPGDVNVWANVDLAPGQIVAEAITGDPDVLMYYTYSIPSSLNGEYYFVAIADAYDVLREADEENNFSFAFNEDYVSVVNGVISSYTKKKSTDIRANKPVRSIVTKNNLNAYTTDEISTMLTYYKRSGKLKEKISEYLKSGKTFGRYFAPRP